MKKFSVFLVSILLLSLGMLANAGNLSIADNPNYLDMPGMSPGVCTLINPDGTFGGTSTSALTISTPSENGNAVYKCRGKVPAPPNKQALRWDNTSPGFIGVMCDMFEDGVYIGSTDDWWQETSANGNSMTTCIKHP